MENDRDQSETPGIGYVDNYNKSSKDVIKIKICYVDRNANNTKTVDIDLKKILRIHC